MSLSFPRLGTMGQLGNQLWQFASSTAISRLHYTEPAFPDNWEYRNWFAAIPQEFFHPPAELNRMAQTIDQPEVKRIDDRANIYLQDYSLFSWMAQEIKGYLAPSNEVLDVLGNQYPWFYDIDTPVCAIHVRRGDSIGKEYWHPMCTMRYYEKACAMVKDWEPEITFVVFSDDIPWCRKNFPKDYIMCNRREGRPVDIEELFLMSKCEEHIIANSTFSWWGAWLSKNKRVINPDIWYGPAYPYLNQAKALILDSWISVGCHEPTRDEFEYEIEKRAEGWDENIRYYYPDLTYNSKVWDVGAFEGEFAERINGQYGCEVTAFEILPSYSEMLYEKFWNNPKILVKGFGLDGNKKNLTVTDEGNCTSTFIAGEVEITLYRASDLMGDDHLDLMKLNTEGSEYEILYNLIENGKMPNIKHLQVQFHKWAVTPEGFVDIPNAEENYDKIVQLLSETHKRDWYWPWTWESWSLK